MAAQQEEESLFIVNDFALKFFQSNLPAVGLEYFGNRGFTDAAIQKFSLGFALESWYAFAKAATQTGFKLEYHSLSGKVIAFAVC